jgi:hypothetical protein
MARPRRTTDRLSAFVLSEQGESALATPGPTSSPGWRGCALDEKTWNHPVVAGGLLLVSNGEEMVAFRLPRVR